MPLIPTGQPPESNGVPPVSNGVPPEPNGVPAEPNGVPPEPSGVPPERQAPRTALLLSSGAMFGAYHAGAWKALAPRFRPHVVVGASIGSLNGWMIAGGATPDFLEDRWLHAGYAGSFRVRFPRHWLDGWLDAPFLERAAREIAAQFQPKTEFGLVATRVWPLRPELFVGPNLTWQHLASSCAVPFLFPHYRLGGALYTDGGLMQAMPLWPARQLGCTRVVAVNCLPRLPFPGGRLLSKVLRAVSGFRHQLPGDIEVLTIAPSQPMGGIRDFLVWKRSNAQRWIALGYADALAAIKANPHWFSNSPHAQQPETVSS